MMPGEEGVMAHREPTSTRRRRRTPHLSVAIPALAVATPAVAMTAQSAAMASEHKPAVAARVVRETRLQGHPFGNPPKFTAEARRVPEAHGANRLTVTVHRSSLAASATSTSVLRNSAGKLHKGPDAYTWSGVAHTLLVTIPKRDTATLGLLSTTFGKFGGYTWTAPKAPPKAGDWTSPSQLAIC